MDAGEYIVGLLFFMGTAGSCAVTAVLLWRRYLGHLRGLAGVLAGATLFFAVLVVAHLLPGMMGLLHRGWVLAAGVILAAGAAVVTSRRAIASHRAAAASDSERSIDGDPGWALTGCLALAVAVAAWGLTLLWQRKTTLASPPFSFDMLTFDLPLVARWIQSGSIWVAHDLVPLNSHAAYPQNGDLVYLAAILPWHNAFLAPIITYPLWALGGLGVFAVARELGAWRWAAVLLASVYAAVPLLLLTTASDNTPDVFMWAVFTVGVLFLVRHVRAPRDSELLLAGIALGLAFGSKWYGLTCVPLVALMWLIASGVMGRGHRLRREAPILVGLILAFGAFWLVRNVLEYGDPIFPRPISLFGVSLFSSPVDIYGQKVGFTVAHYIGDWQVWRKFLIPEYRDVLRLGGLLLVSALVVIPPVAIWLVRRDRGYPAGSRPAGAFVAVTALAIGVVYLVTPQTAVGPEGMPTLAGINARYGVPALLLAAAATAWGVSAWVRARWVPLLALAIAVVAVADAYRSPLTVSALRAAVAGALLLAGGYVAIRIRRAGAIKRARSRLNMVIALAAVVVLGAAGSGYALQRRFNSEGLGGRDPVVDWVLTHARDHTRIGMTGSWSTDVPPVLAMFGRTLGNSVTYVGRVDHGLVQHFSSYGAWIRVVRGDRLDLLLVGRQPQPLEKDAEAGWAARAHFPVATMSSRFILYRPTATP